jgi:hypothetical protein
MTSLKDHARAVRYRQLALRETDRSRTALLNLIAHEAERGVLVTWDRSTFNPIPSQPEAQQPYHPFRYQNGTPPGAA